MSKDKKNKKTLSLKLGSKRSFSPVKSFETGKTVIVEKKRFRKTNSTQSSNKENSNQTKKIETKEPLSSESI